MLKTGHSVTRPGRRLGDRAVNIPVPEELETAPGIVQNPQEVDFYSREYPLESQAVEYTADREWAWTVYTTEDWEDRRINDAMSRPIVQAAHNTGDIEPTVEPEFGKDVTELIRTKAREMGFGEVGFTRYDRRYVYKFKRDWSKFPNAICLAYEQDFEPTQSAPSREAEGPHYAIYRIMGALALDLADYIRSLGYHAQVHNPLSNSAVMIPMFVEAGLGQLGANGQLLSPHFGSRARLMMITTDAEVTYDQPVDYGIHAFCNICQVCVNRCPARALMRDKVWWRGAEKHKLIYRRCRPVMTRYEGCAVCMKTCPIQRYGMENVMSHYASTGQVLGKGTHLLEGYNLRDMGYFGPGELPRFASDFFHVPHGKAEDVLFEDLKDKIKNQEIPEGPEGDQMLRDFVSEVHKFVVVNPAEMVSLPSGTEVEEA